MLTIILFKMLEIKSSYPVKESHCFEFNAKITKIKIHNLLKNSLYFEK